MMHPYRLEQVADWIQAQVRGGCAQFSGVSIDTRRLSPGELFVALPGEHHDGHDFLDAAVRGGASSVLVAQPADLPIPRLEVENTLTALGRLGAFNRLHFQGPVAAITGSVGKSTTRALLESILSRKGRVLATQGNYNNEIGLPLTLLKLSQEHDFAVLEMGACRRGDIAYLCGLAKPRLAVLTMVAHAHLESFGSLEEIIAAKGEIFSGLAEDGIAVMNFDLEAARDWLRLLRGQQVLSFALENPEADFRADEIITDPSGRVHFQLHGPQGKMAVRLGLVGSHNVINALAAAAAAWGLGCSLEDIAGGLADSRPLPGRLCPHQGAHGLNLIDDSYNASPSSLHAAIRVLADQPSGRRALVLGDMAELGEQAADFHEQAGHEARKMGLDELLALGGLAARAARSFGHGGRDFAGPESLVTYCLEHFQAGDSLLIKGSRAARMERVLSALKAG